MANGASKANAEIKEIQNENTINIFTVKVMTCKNHHEACRRRARVRQKWLVPYLMNEGRSDGSNMVVKASLLIEQWSLGCYAANAANAAFAALGIMHDDSREQFFGIELKDFSLKLRFSTRPIGQCAVLFWELKSAWYC